ncbi:MAG: 2-hydroxychromene-2-carboxylate isomerase, partial [Moraxellaceae bacterium]|nr:2-hydroxychromene-2-carboxylate isomerase [Moraxellaceae bacterium]
MPLAKLLQPRLASLLTSPRTRKSLRQLQETKRRLGAQPHVVSVWLRADDPYSYLL